MTPAQRLFLTLAARPEGTHLGVTIKNAQEIQDHVKKYFTSVVTPIEKYHVTVFESVVPDLMQGVPLLTEIGHSVHANTVKFVRGGHGRSAILAVFPSTYIQKRQSQLVQIEEKRAKDLSIVPKPHTSIPHLVVVDWVDPTRDISHKLQEMADSLNCNIEFGQEYSNPLFLTMPPLYNTFRGRPPDTYQPLSEQDNRTRRGMLSPEEISQEKRRKAEQLQKDKKKEDKKIQKRLDRRDARDATREEKRQQELERIARQEHLKRELDALSRLGKKARHLQPNQ